jgi:hypothetical protein
MSFWIAARGGSAGAARRGQGFVRWLGSTVVERSPWSVVGEFPNIPKLVAIAAPHSSNWDGIIGIAIAYALGVRATWMGKNSCPPGLDRLMRGPATSRPQQSARRGRPMAIGCAPNPVVFLAPEGTRKVVKNGAPVRHIASEAGADPAVAIDYPA